MRVDGSLWDRMLKLREGRVPSMKKKGLRDAKRKRDAKEDRLHDAFNVPDVPEEVLPSDGKGHSGKGTASSS